MIKQYIKHGIIKNRNQIVIRKDGMQIFNPTEDMLLADGWKDYVIPEPTIEDYRRRKKREILNYDSSNEVNAFFIHDQEVWLDKATRAGLMLRFQAEIAAKRDSTTLWHDGHQYPLTLAAAMQMLYALELYASQCYDVTQAHLAAVDAMQSIEAVENYDFTTGYPNKLEF